MSKHYTFAQQMCIKKAGLALQTASPLYSGARIGVAVSGGIDSMVLLRVLEIRKNILPFRTSLIALHCNPGFDPGTHFELAKCLAEMGVAAHLEAGDFGPFAHSDGNKKKSPCFLCAWERRKHLFNLCKKYKLTHLAIGHNADDLGSTFMMNFFRNGNSAALPIAEKFFNGALCLVRPLLLVEKKVIRQAARQWGLPIFANVCPSSGKTWRSKMEKILEKIDEEVPGAKRSAINALIRNALKNREEKN